METDSRSRYLIALCIILGIKAVLMIGVILYSGIGLGPDEAQYWTWSRYLDWGYYSKPPGIAWQIWLGTHLFGNTELGVRFLSVILGILLSLSTFWLGLKSSLQARTAFWAALSIAFIPMGILGSFLAITDGGLVLFWTIAAGIIASGLSKEESPNYLLLGLAIFCGALFKWPIFLMWAVVICLIPFYPFLLNAKLFVGIVISLLGLFPSVIWNSDHDWVTFKHVYSQITGGPGKAEATQSIVHGNFLEFLGTQAALISPILFIILLFAFGYLMRFGKRIPAALFFCGASSLVILLGYFILSVFQKIQGNWCDFVYPTAIVFLCWYAIEVAPRAFIWLKAGLVLSVVLCAAILSIPYVQQKGIYKEYPIPYKFNPFKHNVGWNGLSDVINRSGYNPSKDFLFSDKYQMSSILSFYGPEQKKAYFLNLQGSRRNQFSYWPGMPEEQKGKTGYFVLAENSPYLERDLSIWIKKYQDQLQKYFKEVRFVGLMPLFDSYGIMAKGVLIFKGIDYNGLEPIPSELY